MKKKRDTFTGKLGLLLSCIGASVGLGNIWMFPYRLGENGGAAFLIPYFIFIFLLGITGAISEFAFGRYTGSGPLKGIQTIFKKKSIKCSNIIGSIPVISLGGTFIFYSVVVGWILKYFSLSLTFSLPSKNLESYFSKFTNSYETLIWFSLAIVITLTIICIGVSKGIEKINKIFMPLLFIIFIILTIKSITLPGASKGIRYLFMPRWSYLFRIKTWIMALGQAFFTISLTGCALVVFGSYSDKKIDLGSIALQTAIFDIISALLSALLIIPAAFAFNLDINSGPSLMFITIPKIFNSLPNGQIFSIIFFLSMIFAAISSAIIMLEGPVEALLSQSNLSRKKASLIISIFSFIIGVPICLNGNLFKIFSDTITIFLSPLGTLIISIVLYYIIGEKTALVEINLGRKKTFGKLFIFLSKYIFVIITFIIIILGIIYRGI